MSKNTMSNIMCTAVFALGLLASTGCYAHGGGGWHGGGGGWHGGGGGWHGGGGGYYHGGYHGGYYGGGWWGPGIVIGAPFGGYYYDSGPACQTVRVCNNYGHCWLQESCY